MWPRALAAAYSDAQLSEKQLGFGGVLIVCDRMSVSLLDKSVSNQTIKGQPFICIQIFLFFQHQSAYDIAKDRQFFVGEGDGFCHLTLHKSSRPSALYSV